MIMSVSDLENNLGRLIATTALIQMPEVSENLYTQFCKLFLESNGEIIQTLHANKANRPDLKKAAHKLKGACSFTGALRLQLLAANLEEVAESLSAAEVDYYLSAITRVFTDTKKEISGFVERAET